MSDLRWHDDRIPMEYRVRFAREHNERMRGLAEASRAEAKRLADRSDADVLIEQALRDAAEFDAQVTSFGGEG